MPYSDEAQIEMPSSGYVFNINLISGGFAYFTTYTEMLDAGDNGRERREPNSIKPNIMAKALEDLGHYLYIVNDDSSFKHWLSHRGWAIVYKDYCKKNMELWLKPKYCLKKPSGAYCDVSISSPLSKNRQTTKLRKQVLQRDGHMCFLCGKSEDDNVKITMHHIRPFSKGGETSLENLITLCKPCNQNIGDNFLFQLYDLIDVIYGYDIGLLKGKLDMQTWQWLRRLSSNFMHTRCELI